MTCKKCHEGELIPTQVPRVALGLGRVGYTVAFGAALLLGAVVGLGLAAVGEGGVDLSWALIAIPVVLVGFTPLVVFGALRAFAEKKVWQCRQCDYMFDRA